MKRIRELAINENELFRQPPKKKSVFSFCRALFGCAINTYCRNEICQNDEK